MAIISQIFVYSALVLAVAFGQNNQRAVLYDQSNGDGNYIIIPEDYVEDLSRIGFDNRIRSVCVTGVWLFYQDADFNPAGSRGMEYVFGENNYCANIRTIAGTISSVRYAGAPGDYTTDTFTLYEGDYFQAREEYTQTDLPNLNLAGNHKSIIITGHSDWTVYDRPSFGGNSICLRMPEPGTPAFINDLESLDPIIPHGTIRSVSKGCFSSLNNNYTLSSFARMNTKNSFVQTNVV